MKKDLKEAAPTVLDILGETQDDIRESLDLAEVSLDNALEAVQAAKKRLKDLG